LKKGYRTQKVVDFKIGDHRAWILSDGLFRLDGGAMFGVVPRVLWEKSNPPDTLNRITLGLNPLLVQCGSELVIIDTGIGGKSGESFKEMFSVEHRPTLEQSLAEAGFTREDVTMVINTHLHFDHAGGNTVRDENGKIVPTFPSAVYVVQDGEWEDALNCNERNRRSYIEDDFVPLEKEGILRRVRGEVELADGLRVIPTPGHTRHHQSVLVSSRGERAFYAGDLIPTSSHVPYPYIMGYDLYPMETLRTKQAILPRAFEENWLLVFEHEPILKLGTLDETGKGFIAARYPPEN
jgi:glyoxylase-like metal-dependent hydrolase (beta-lactamase superfamily II)